MDGPIPWTAVQLYGEHKSLASDVVDLLWGIIQTLDAAERKWHHENPPPKDLERNSGDAA
jgi:hypothetical protein